MPHVKRDYTVDPDGNCDRCGKRHWSPRGNRKSCEGHARTERVDGQVVKLDQERPCTHLPVPGYVNCHRHGVTKAQREAAKQRQEQERAMAQAEKLLARFGVAVDTTPTEALLDVVKWTAGHVAWLRTKVAAAVEDDDLTQHSTVSGKREASVWVDLLGTWQDKLVRACDVAIRAGIEERRVRIAEQQGALVADVIRKVLDSLDLTPEQAGKAGEVVPLELRRLAG